MKNLITFFHCSIILVTANFSFAVGQVWMHYDTTNSAILDNYITDIAIDASGNKWFGTINHGVIRFDGVTWTNYNPLPPPYYIKAIAAEGDTIWAGGVYGLARYVAGNWTVYNSSNSGLPCNDITAIAFDGFGNKWIGTTAGFSGGGLTKFDGTSWTNYNSSNSGITFSIALSIGIDQNNNIWAGSSGLDTNATRKGLAKFDGSNWTIYDTSNSAFPDPFGASSITFDTSGNLWAGTGYSGLVKYDGLTWTVFDTANTPALNGTPYNTFSAYIDHTNIKWIAGIGKFVTYNDVNWTVYDSSNSPLPWNIKATQIDFENNNRVWIATSLYGVYVYDLSSSDEMPEEKNSELNIFPNPFQLNTNIEKNISSDIFFILYNDLGIEVRRLFLQDDVTAFDRENLPAGFYYYSCLIPNHSVAEGKLIIY